MTMVSSGPISLGGSATSGGLNQSVNIELGRSATASINMNESAVRTLAGVASGAISMSNFYGKANQFSFSITTNTANVDLRTAAIAAGWNQSSSVVCTINAGIIVFSNSTGSAAMTISGSFPGGVQLINNGTILGRGGNGGNDGTNNATSGGPGLSVSTAVSINNGSGRIAGGGGGGASTYGNSGSCNESIVSLAGAGGGGGIGNGQGGTSGAGPARAGQNGTLAVPGAGGPGECGPCGICSSATGGTGGTYGSAGSGSGSVGLNPGSGGAAVNGNSNITWIAFGTRNGAIN